MNAWQRSHTKVAALVLTGILGASAGVLAAGVLPDQAERGMNAWTERLTDQADAYRFERSDAAYGSRLRLMAQQRADQAYTDRLNGLAGAHGHGGLSDRAAQAWTDRLNGLADQ